MTEQEVYNELKQKVKPYIGIMPQGSYSNYMIRLKAGLLKPATIKTVSYTHLTLPTILRV